MSNATLNHVERILEAYRDNPRDWLRVTDIANRTGLSESAIETTLQSFPDKFEAESVFGGRVYGLNRKQFVLGRAASVSNA